MVERLVGQHVGEARRDHLVLGAEQPEPFQYRRRADVVAVHPEHAVPGGQLLGSRSDHQPGLERLRLACEQVVVAQIEQPDDRWRLGRSRDPRHEVDRLPRRELLIALRGEREGRGGSD